MEKFHPNKAYLEHVAFKVKDIHWHIRFFRDVLGMTLREVDGDPASPRQAWTFGGLQLMADPEFEGPEGRFAHLGVMCEDVDAAIAAAQSFGVLHLDKGPNWLVLHDGLIVELIAASPGTVAAVLAVNPRA
ncbi:glyoxalase [Bradyrhizobium manausense]|uniref:VOC family protein n=1 Tax=Bradyrhizobium manausense TaxID=989370 RepID=UPI001BA8A611|nr:VOC family protein [Bradyrhizobium manausense]MBR0687867.1 glyoxalase [Bradyrhizobium manausense]